MASIEAVGDDACGEIDSVEFGREADSGAALQDFDALSLIRTSYSVQIARHSVQIAKSQ